MEQIEQSDNKKVKAKKPMNWKPYNVKLVASQQLLKKQKKLKDDGIVVQDGIEVKIDSLNVFDDKKEYSNWRKLNNDIKKEKLIAFFGKEHPKLQEILEHVDNKTLPKVTYDKVNERIKCVDNYSLVNKKVDILDINSKLGAKCSNGMNGGMKKKGGKKVPSLFKKI